MLKSRLERAALSSDSAKVLVHELKALLSEGENREEILTALEEIVMNLRSKELEEAENVVLDVMDLLVGWCSPEQKL